MTPRPLMPQQRTAVRLLKEWGGCGCLFMAPGTGKTTSLITYAQRFRYILIICGRDDFLTWELELTEYFETTRTDIWFQGIDPDTLPTTHTPKWYFITYDMLRNLHYSKWVKSFPFSLVAVDESQRIKRWESERTRAVVRATRHIRRRIVLSGSPITNKVVDLFSQCLFVDNGKTFGTSVFWFKKQYYVQGDHHAWYPKRGVKEIIIRKLRNIAYHIHEDDCLNLPPIIRRIKGAPLSAVQSKHYQDILENWEYTIRDGETTELNQVIVQLEKLKQIAGGFIQDSETRQVTYLDCPKFDLLKTLVDEINKPKIVVWASRTAEILRIIEWANQAKIKTVAHYGSKRKDKRAARLQFRDDPGTRIFVAQVDSGVGMNELMVSDTAIYYSQSTKVQSKQQSMRRTRRKGSEIHKRIFYYELVTEGTVDRALLTSIGGMMDFAQSILNKIKRGQTPWQALKT